MKKIVSLLLSAFLVLTVMATSVSATPSGTKMSDDPEAVHTYTDMDGNPMEDELFQKVYKADNKLTRGVGPDCCGRQALGSYYRESHAYPGLRYCSYQKGTAVICNNCGAEISYRQSSSGLHDHR